MQRRLQLGTGRSEVLQEFHFPVEVNHEGQIFVLAKKFIEEAVACAALLIEDAALAEAGVHQEAQPQRQVAFVREIVDGLGTPVFIQLKIVFG